MKSKLKLTYERFLAYFSNKLTGKEKHVFEKSVMQDEFESDAYDGLSKLSSLELQQDLDDLNLSLENRIKSKRRKSLVWLPYAASIVIILGLSFVLYYINQTPSVNEFVSQDIEKSQAEVEIKKSPVSSTDTLKEEIDKKSRQAEEFVIADEEEFDDAEFEIVTIEEDEDIAFVEEVRDVEMQKSKSLVRAIEVKQDQASEITNNKIEEALSGKVAGVATSKKEAGIKIRGVSKISNDKAIRKISGQVVDGNQEPLTGVSIVVKGTEQGVTTDIDGNFTMSLIDTNSDYKLAASFVGFETQEFDVSDSLLVVLEQDSAGLNEVVVTGYSSQEKTTTNSVAGVEMDQPTKIWNNARPSQSKNISEYKEKLISDLQYEFRNQLKGKYKVKVSFTVNSYGTISDIRIKGDKNQELYEKIKTLINNGEKWFPAESNETSVDSKVRFTLRMNFN
jgi:hypothetical protein